MLDILFLISLVLQAVLGRMRTLMVMYACARLHDQAETLSKRLQLNVVQLNILIQSL